MKVLIVNGSPRKEGNSYKVSRIVGENISKECEVEIVDITKYKIAGCMGCDGCRKNHNICVIKDDGKLLTDKFKESDIIIFVSPMYWWGISSQLKAYIDRLYVDDYLKNKKSKKIGIISIGADDLEDVEYSIVRTQFESMCKYFDWELIFSHSFCALEKGEVLKDIEKIEKIWNYQ